MIRFISIAILCIMHTLPALAEPVPGWVTPLETQPAADTPSDYTAYGVLHLLQDRQVRLTDTGFEDYQRRVIKIVKRTALESEGALSFDYDPTRETLEVNDIWRIRDGVRSRVSGLEFIDIRREASLSYGILDGRLTRYADVPDLQVGDILDVGTTRRGAPSVFTDHFQAWVTARPIHPYQVDRFRLVTPTSQEVIISGPAEPIVTRSPEWTEHIWTHSDTPPDDFEHYWHDWHAHYGFTQVTTGSSWAEIVERVVDDYQPQALPAEVLSAINTFDGTTAQKVGEALRFVQDEIRYMGIEIGDGGYLPRAPELVWSRRFGDCKDKALLLVSILVEMGIAADVVLVNSYEGEELDSRAPSPFLFNHAIVRVLGDGEPYFVDPTDVLQGGTGRDVRVPDYAWALPLSPGSDALVEVPQLRPTEPTYEVLSRYEFKDTGQWAAELFVTISYRGDDADYHRYNFDRQGSQDREESHLEWYQDRYPGAETLTAMRIEDDLAANVLVIHEHFGLTEGGLADSRSKFWMNPYAVANQLEDLPDEGLLEPYPLDPLFHRHRVELVGFDGLKAPRDFSLDDAFVRYSAIGYEIPDGIGGDFEIEVLATEVRPDQAEAYTDMVEHLDRNDDRKYRLDTSSRVLAASLWMGLSLNVWLLIGSFAVPLALAMIGGVVGYRRERAALG